MKTFRSFLSNPYLRPYINGFKRLFYTQTEQSDKLSLLKLLLFVAYILGIIFAFLHFATVTEADLEVEVSINPIEGQTGREYLSLTPFGVIAVILNFFIFLGALYFTLTQDTSLSKLWLRAREFGSQSRLHLVVVVAAAGIGVGTVILSGLQLLYDISGVGFSTVLESFSFAMSAMFGTGFFYLWMVLQPILFFNGLLLVLDIINQDYPLKGHSKQSIGLLGVSVLLAIAIFVIIAEVFDVTLDIGEPALNVILPFWGIGVYLDSIFWLLINTISLTSTALTLFLVLIVVDLFLSKRRGSTDFREIRKAILPWLFFFGLVLIVIQAIPAFFALEGRLKSLTDFFDLLGLLVFLVLGIFRVTTIPENSKQLQLAEIDQNYPRKWWQQLLAFCNPLNWWKYVPAYSKALVLFFIGFSVFFGSLESYTIATILNTENKIKILKLQMLSGTCVLGFLYVFWRYKPTIIEDLTTPGPIKTVEALTKEKFRKGTERIDDF